MAAEHRDLDACDCKIGRNIERYHLNKLNQQLLQNRQKNDLSLRDLAAFINQRILEAAIEDASGKPLAEETDLFGALERDDAIEAIYNALQDDDVSPDRRARVRTRLGQTGVDLDAVESHWITHTTVSRHLTECLDIETGSVQSLDPDDATDTIEWIRTRCKAIVERTLERLQSAGRLDVGELDISVSIRATCTECGKTYTPDEVITRGGCDCYQSSARTE
jgi:hypothetical protein